METLKCPGTTTCWRQTQALIPATGARAAQRGKQGSHQVAVTRQGGSDGVRPQVPGGQGQP